MLSIATGHLLLKAMENHGKLWHISSFALFFPRINKINNKTTIKKIQRGHFKQVMWQWKLFCLWKSKGLKSKRESEIYLPCSIADPPGWVISILIKNFPFAQSGRGIEGVWELQVSWEMFKEAICKMLSLIPGWSNTNTLGMCLCLESDPKRWYFITGE